MAIFKAFRAVRPVNEHAQDVAALPYDVMNSEEATVLTCSKIKQIIGMELSKEELQKEKQFMEKI